MGIRSSPGFCKSCLCPTFRFQMPIPDSALMPWGRLLDTDDLNASRWRPTNAHVRASAMGLLGLVLALVLGRANMFVLAVPFVVIATGGEVRRPVHQPTTSVRLDQSTVPE